MASVVVVFRLERKEFNGDESKFNATATAPAPAPETATGNVIQCLSVTIGKLIWMTTVKGFFLSYKQHCRKLMLLLLAKIGPVFQSISM